MVVRNNFLKKTVLSTASNVGKELIGQIKLHYQPLTHESDTKNLTAQALRFRRLDFFASTTSLILIAGSTALPPPLPPPLFRAAEPLSRERSRAYKRNSAIAETSFASFAARENITMDKLNVAAAARGGFPPTKMIGDLDKDVKYIVIKFRRVNTKYGPKLVCHTQTIHRRGISNFSPRESLQGDG